MRNPYPEMDAFEDDVLVDRAQKGDDRAFAVLISRHYATCRKLALSILRNQEDAEDEVQNTYWKAYEHIAGFHRDAKFSTWLARIVVNQCLMRLRQNRRANLVSIDEPVHEDAQPVEVPDRSATPEQELGKREVITVLRKEIRRIPPLLREPLVLRDVERLPMSEVAARLGISLAAAKSRLLRARSELKDRMLKYACPRMGAAVLLG